ncbi:MAG TPA: thymidine kinase [Myxococcales bacterium]|nr:thymidine kinase [Myxococcales bacterium]
MFSGKSEELIRRLRRAKIARRRVQVFKPRIDDRYHATSIASHSEHTIEARPIDRAKDILRYTDDRTEVVGIDEAQFFDEEVVEVCQKLANLGKRVIVAGLDQDYLGQPFEPVPQLMAIAEYVTKTLAVCMRCGAPANRTQRLIASADRVVVGATDSYEARCRRCFEPELSQQLHLAVEEADKTSQNTELAATDAETPAEELEAAEDQGNHGAEYQGELEESPFFTNAQ